MDRGKQDTHIENRLRDIVVEPHSQVLLAVADHGVSGQRNHRQVVQGGVVADTAEDFSPVDFGKRDIENDNVGPVVLETFDGVRRGYDVAGLSDDQQSMDLSGFLNLVLRDRQDSEETTVGELFKKHGLTAEGLHFERHARVYYQPMSADIVFEETSLNPKVEIRYHDGGEYINTRTITNAPQQQASPLDRNILFMMHTHPLNRPEPSKPDKKNIWEFGYPELIVAESGDAEIWAREENVRIPPKDRWDHLLDQPEAINLYFYFEKLRLDSAGYENQYLVSSLEELIQHNAHFAKHWLNEVIVNYFKIEGLEGLQRLANFLERTVAMSREQARTLAEIEFIMGRDFS